VTTLGVRIHVLRLVALGSTGLLLACAPQPSPPTMSAPTSAVAETETPVAVVESAPPTATAAPSPSVTRPPTVQKRIVTVKQRIPFTTRTVKDSSMPVGTSKVRVSGVAGVKTFTYEVTFTDGVETGRKLLREVVTTAPVARVVVVGTKQQRRCDPNYSGACVPIASDVDCAGGSGNGPAYVTGPVRVIGTDIYRLDNDGDGIGCE
jgi:hypothetical protein